MDTARRSSDRVGAPRGPFPSGATRTQKTELSLPLAPGLIRLDEGQRIRTPPEPLRAAPFGFWTGQI